MKDLPKISDLDIQGKKVLVRVDLDYKDLPARAGDVSGTKRQEALLATLEYLVERASEIILLSHRGRPGGKTDDSLSTKPVADRLEDFLRKKWGEEKIKRFNMFIMENLRFNPGESLDYTRDKEAKEFAEHLAEEGNAYVNEAFASSHRKHASIVALPGLLPHAAGFHFVKEVENLGRVLENPQRPVVVIIGGVKEDKLTYVEPFKKFADRILIGGRLPTFLPEDYKEEKVVVAKLNQDRQDITLNSIEEFEKEIAKAKTLVVSGPMGKFEDEGQRLGTERVLKVASESSAFKVVGGGDTQRALSTFGLSDKFDWVSVGGGAMLEFLAKGTLPGIEALLN